jgi:hypothetical protein
LEGFFRGGGNRDFRAMQAMGRHRKTTAIGITLTPAAMRFRVRAV